MEDKEKLWFLIKSSWIDWLVDLSMEQRGEFFTALYTGEKPEGIAGAFVKNNIEEFRRVNDYKAKSSKTNQINGKMGGAPKGNANAKKYQPKNKQKTTEYQAIISNLQAENKHIDKDIATPIDTNTGLDREIDKELYKVISNNTNISFKDFISKSREEKDACYNSILNIPAKNRTYGQSAIISLHKMVENEY